MRRQEIFSGMEGAEGRIEEVGKKETLVNSASPSPGIPMAEMSLFCWQEASRSMRYPCARIFVKICIQFKTQWKKLDRVVYCVGSEVNLGLNLNSSY